MGSRNGANHPNRKREGVSVWTSDVGAPIRIRQDHLQTQNSAQVILNFLHNSSVPGTGIKCRSHRQLLPCPISGPRDRIRKYFSRILVRDVAFKTFRNPTPCRSLSAPQEGGDLIPPDCTGNSLPPVPVIKRRLAAVEGKKIRCQKRGFRESSTFLQPEIV